MENNKLEYKGFTTHIKWSEPDKCYYGKIETISDLVLFEGETVEECEKDFYDAVNDYIDFCKEIGDEILKKEKTSATNETVDVDISRLSPTENADISLLTPTENIDLNNLNPDNKTKETKNV